MGKNNKYIKQRFSFLLSIYGFIITKIYFYKQYYKNKYHRNYKITFLSYNNYGLFSLERNDCGYEFIREMKILFWTFNP
jgi:hypothetical protein